MQRANKRTLTSTYHISFFVEESFNLLVRGISSEIYKKYNTKFVVDGKQYIPHLTLYLFSAPIQNQKKMIERLMKIAGNFKPPVLKVKGLILSFDGWLMIEIKNKSKLRRYHKVVVKNINSLREGVLRIKYRKAKEILTLPKEERIILKKYGDRHSMNLYNPHISITQFEDMEKAKKAFDEYKTYFQNKRVKIKSLGLVRDYTGTGAVGKLLFSQKY